MMSSKLGHLEFTMYVGLGLCCMFLICLTSADSNLLSTGGPDVTEGDKHTNSTDTATEATGYPQKCVSSRNQDIFIEQMAILICSSESDNMTTVQEWYIDGAWMNMPLIQNQSSVANVLNDSFIQCTAIWDGLTWSCSALLHTFSGPTDAFNITVLLLSVVGGALFVLLIAAVYCIVRRRRATGQMKIDHSLELGAEDNNGNGYSECHGSTNGYESPLPTGDIKGLSGSMEESGYVNGRLKCKKYRRNNITKNDIVSKSVSEVDGTTTADDDDDAVEHIYERVSTKTKRYLRSIKERMFIHSKSMPEDGGAVAPGLSGSMEERVYVNGRIKCKKYRRNNMTNNDKLALKSVLEVDDKTTADDNDDSIQHIYERVSTKTKRYLRSIKNRMNIHQQSKSMAEDGGAASAIDGTTSADGRTFADDETTSADVGTGFHHFYERISCKTKQFFINIKEQTHANQRTADCAKKDARFCVKKTTTDVQPATVIAEDETQNDCRSSVIYLTILPATSELNGDSGSLREGEVVDHMAT